ncbi:tRNA preQ1(34) S-adenosylmethionine ribosyltransferase-isomerase QueA [Methylotenera sp.]|uniref:tRNA preQ1(34) S-adenosylmethionine ribosyltransferase-isomerase QueA n=1 Tax=Methylotenera sp. TaxID=2051956 RepID=UPI0027225B89|nr:tRNA preQ1(34) S-adenosylmethionine ribosyltransferase-isomerase QueA [Methylotenera sp.]MDO9234266.1 tRNA preQ1(34) S-adenosylmethionine ribosyltransferase-isomerase QueA [Methylotenera sp.]MDP2230521.1 tRNA preQ1(34) S-adenosylmethionine ribosyltransferase-isomerase QueA [Methylotenera sp.]MDP3140312.1 tRNA preQ1(34) S-adenosylmethionine ribosyltransferase-isomerase QueA [Methylotenera sp.]MDP3308008.1 tRNA preQ1(34) S-adenosylmethionine ribosyltransferase-isomerase QueA [Methylotenera sp.
MRTEDFDFYLPNELIAQHPTADRSASRMLHLNAIDNHLADKAFIELPDCLQAGDLLIFNDTRVIKARLFGHKHSGGNIEVLIERVINQHIAYAHVRASRAPKIGSRIKLANAFDVEVTARHDDLFELRFLSEFSVLDLLEQYGALPLPPYITHKATSEDEERYQTVFSKHLGAVAAPTAGLHFNESVLQTLKEKGINIAYVTLHVGAGTFQPVRVENIHEHIMHSELYSISQTTIDMITETKMHGGKVTAVGTTVLRALESAARISDTNTDGHLQVGSGETNIFITPGYHFKVVDRLFTNFHLPKSTLLMLVSAFAGVENIKRAYQHAIAKHYRFFSYGDAMLLEKQTNA